MARAALAFALLAVVGLAVAVPGGEGPARRRPAPQATPAAVHPPVLSSVAPVLLRSAPRIRLAPAPRQVPRAPRDGAPCFREGGGPCIRLCTYLARAGQAVTAGCPAVAPAGCLHFVTARPGCAPLTPRAITVVPRTRVLPLPRRP